MKNLKIGVRLGVGFGILIAVLLLSALFAVRNMGVLANITKDLYNHPMTVTNAILAADGNVVRMHRSMKDVALAKTPEDVQKAANAVDGYEKHVYEDMKVVKSAFLGPPKMVEDITRPIAEWKPIRDRVIALMKEGKAEEAANITKTEGVVKTDEIRKAVGELKEWAQKKGVAFFENAEKTRSESVWIFVIANAIGIVLAVIVTFYISSSITNPIREAVGVAEALAKGDLTQKIEAKSKDETGQLLAALGNTVMQLKGIMGGIKESTETISTASSQIAQGNADLSQRTEEQASSLEETASSMEELTSTVKQNAENAKQANQLAISASAVAVKGGAVVSQVVSTMSSINDSSKKIVDIIGVMWIGLLWYFNFVQIPSMPKIPDEQKPAISKVIAPTALFWFRWAALATVVTGLLLAAMSGYVMAALGLQKPVVAIGIGMWLALIMAVNVWFIIWPNQKKALGLVTVEPAEKAQAARTAMLTSRINTMLSIPMLYCMVAQQNGGL